MAQLMFCDKSSLTIYTIYHKKLASNFPMKKCLEKTQEPPEGIPKYLENMSKPLLKICFSGPLDECKCFCSLDQTVLYRSRGWTQLIIKKKKRKKLFKRIIFPCQGCEEERSSLIKSPDGN